MNAEAAILRAQLAAMKKERDLFRSAVLDIADGTFSYCPWCDNTRPDHAAGCVVRVAEASWEQSEEARLV